MTIGTTNGYDEFMNSEKGYDPFTKKIVSYEYSKDLTDNGRTQYTYQSLQLKEKEIIEQDRKLLEKEIAEYLLEEYDKYSEEEKVGYPWKEFLEMFTIIVYSIAMISWIFHVSGIWKVILVLANFGIILLGGIFYEKIKKHYKNQKEIDDLLCQYGVASMNNRYQEEEILYQQLVEKKVF